MGGESLTKLYIFLKDHIVRGKDESNYTNMEPRRSYYIEDGDEYKKFIKLYGKAIMDGNKFHITQKHKKVGYFIIDIDMKFHKNFGKTRLYVEEDVRKIVEIINYNILKVLKIPNDKMIAFVSEKKKPNIRKNLSADGLHIVYPLFGMHIDTQYFILEKIVQDFKENGIFDAFPLLNKINDVFDRNVIYGANWMLYGSCKPDSDVYKLTHLYKYKKPSSDRCHGKDKAIDKEILNIQVEELPLSTYKEKELFELLNVRKFRSKDCAEFRSKYDMDTIREELENSTKKSKEKKKNQNKKKTNDDSDDETTSTKFYKKEKSDTIKKGPLLQVVTKEKQESMKRAEGLLKLLKKQRYTKYLQWINVGEALYGVDYRMLDVWIEFSQQSKKFKAGECENLWDKFGKYNYGIGSLYYWAKQDNPEGYKKFRSKEIQDYLVKGLDKASYSIAKAVYEIWKNDYVCASIKHGDWFQFKNHRWTPVEEGYTLNIELSEELSNKYALLASDSYAKSIMEEGPEKQRSIDNATSAGKIVIMLKDSKLKDKIMNEAKRLFFNPQFYQRVDENKEIIGFENGVYNLRTKEFRDGVPDDYLTFSTKINYVPYDPKSKKVIWVKNFLKQVQPEKKMRKYVKALLSSYLQGHNPDEKFHIWTGTGCFKLGTRIMLSTGQGKNVEHIEIGDEIMGADGNKKRVKNLLKGNDYLYDVTMKQNDKIISNYTVNSEHKLILSCINNDIKINDENNKIYWYEWDFKSKNCGKPIRVERKITGDVNELSQIINSKRYIDNGENFIITVEEWLNMLSEDKELSNVFGGYKRIIDVEDSDNLDIDPYALGLWLQYGSPKLKSFVGLDDSSKKYLIDKKIIDDKFQLTNEYYDIFNTNKLFNECLGIHIPEKYLCSSKKVRLALIEGIESIKRITNVNNKKLGDCLSRLYNSIGKAARVVKNNDQFEIIIEDVEIDNDIINGSLEITKLDKNNFYGFEIEDCKKINDEEMINEGNNKTEKYIDKRFLLEDYTVVSNSNGKSKLIELFQHAFGQYADTFPITMLTKKRKDADSASPQLAKSKGVRFCVFQEPEEDDKIHVGFMKELTGGDELEARKLFKEPVKFRPQFKLLLTCNKLPHIPSDDKGTWRRLRVVEFTSEFVDNPKKDHEFKIDRSLPKKLPAHAEAFMSILINEFHKYIKNGMVEPKNVKMCTDKYKQKSDTFLEFIRETYVESKKGKISINTMYQLFKTWHRNSYANKARTPTRKELIDYFEKHDYNYDNGNLIGYKYRESKVEKNDLDV